MKRGELVVVAPEVTDDNGGKDGKEAAISGEAAAVEQIPLLSWSIEAIEAAAIAAKLEDKVDEEDTGCWEEAILIGMLLLTTSVANKWPFKKCPIQTISNIYLAIALLKKYDWQSKVGNTDYCRQILYCRNVERGAPKQTDCKLEKGIIEFRRKRVIAAAASVHWKITSFPISIAFFILPVCMMVSFIFSCSLQSIIWRFMSSAT